MRKISLYSLSFHSELHFFWFETSGFIRLHYSIIILKTLHFASIAIFLQHKINCIYQNRLNQDLAGQNFRRSADCRDCTLTVSLPTTITPGLLFETRFFWSEVLNWMLPIDSSDVLICNENLVSKFAVKTGLLKDSVMYRRKHSGFQSSATNFHS